MARILSFVAAALCVLLVAVAHPAHKPERPHGDADSDIAQALELAFSAKVQAEQALGDVLQAAAIGDLTSSQEATDRATQASQLAGKQADLARSIAVAATRWQVRAASKDVLKGVHRATDDAGWAIKGSFQGASDELRMHVNRAKRSPLPRNVVDEEIQKFGRLGAAATDKFNSILDLSAVSTNITVTRASDRIEDWSIEVAQASQAAQAAFAAAEAAQQANSAATTEAPTQAPTDAPTAAPTEAPTEAPTLAPTDAPTEAPTQAPTDAPTEAPTDAPTQAPTDAPTQAPTDTPTEASVSSRRRRSPAVDPFEAARAVLANILANYSEYSRYAKGVAGEVSKDAFDTAARAVDNIARYNSYSTFIPAMSKLIEALKNIDDDISNALETVDRAAAAAVNRL